MPSSHEAVLARIECLYKTLFAHSGYGDMSIEIRFLRKHEKEVLIKCGKQYRFVVPCDCPLGEESCRRCDGEEIQTELEKTGVAPAETEENRRERTSAHHLPRAARGGQAEKELPIE